MKLCTGCKVKKTHSEFHKRAASKDGFSPKCKECASHTNAARRSPGSQSEDYQRRKRDDPDWIRRHNLKQSYGMTLDEFDQILARQGGHCAICATTEPGGRHGRFCVDHDHSTGKLRALLCSKCNVGLGHFNDDPDVLVAAIQYLRSF